MSNINKISITMIVITCALAFTVMAKGYRPVQDVLVYMIPALEYTQVPYYNIYRDAEDGLPIYCLWGC